MKTAIYRRATFNAAHRLHNPAWDDAKNKEVFGVCNNPNYHGHNYVLIVKIIGDINPDTGYVMNLKTLSNMIKKNVTERLDHKNLNMDVPEFSNLNPTAENIAAVIYNILRKILTSDLELQIRLYETENNFVEYPAL
ncbi:MAG: 6-carboxytetrahydropterin synthase [Chitinophagales bacterium]|nr:6-carboxytetrahydropterin synthase [Chitinophagales bacterium]MBP8754528.1 6-carboxytetrahydropterin synthase [Chitinophagales bacterium]MBP9549740.1 6-carboxytetrahydropterin synthase [Chitinophagales bacterium]MBP9795022.1 6-carboxytetrahydropterin synthase [Chitinophagales bacterium]HET8963203.1 6-carboxytetrahydropterin synthase [Chitinophagales bacterium]